MSPLYVITTVFNPRRWASRLRLYNQFATWLKNCGVQLLTVEVAFGERPHAATVAEEPWHLQLATRHELWHKERALNLGLHHLCQVAPNWKYVAWMDSDVQIARPDWAAEAVHLLQHYSIIQLFGNQRFLGPNWEPIFECKGVVKTLEESGLLTRGEHDPGPARINAVDSYAKGGHPGLAWAFRRDVLNDIGGWLDVCANGSGDTHMVNCYAGWWNLGLSPHVSPGFSGAINRYGKLCDTHVHRNIWWMDGTIDHFWHGRSTQRGYEDRFKILVRYQFDPATDLVCDVQGLWKWNLSDHRVRALANEVRKSLAARNEDVNEV